MRLKQILLAACISLCATLGIQAKGVVDIYELTFDQNVNSPKIAKSEVAGRVQDFQNDQAIALINNSLEVELMRNGEVIIVTIPAYELFAPNDTVLVDKSSETLSKLLKFTKTPGMYKMLLVMHSDNTGSRDYLTRLTSARVNAVFDWFDANGNTEAVVPYAFGDIQPLKDNSTMEKRRLNRRLEVYIVPGEAMIEQAKKGKVTGTIISKKRK
ncbi:MAG: OmpA family protein [Bacteroidales bacterium]|nr:OmpA family protein [Bacteroidales bacterium]